MTACPCGSTREYDACCGPLLARESKATTAEALMRSRYTAFTKGDVDYLEQTLRPDTRDDFDRESVSDWAKDSTWQGLEIRSTEAGGEADDKGVVEFVAHFSFQDKPQVHHEASVFSKDADGTWYYVDGKMGPPPRKVQKIGRNDPCTCGSGKKYKKCCGAAV
jgi:SEC-C motif-containing protein